MDITTNQKLKRKRSERASAKRSQDSTLGNMGRNTATDKSTNVKNFPDFAYDDPHVQEWIENRKKVLKKKNPNLTHEDFLKTIRKKITFYNDEVYIDEDDLFILDGKICAWDPDLKNYEEFDWDDPKNKPMIEEEEKRMRHYWETTLQRMTCEELDTLVNLKLSLKKEKPLLSWKEISDIAVNEVLSRRTKP